MARARVVRQLFFSNIDKLLQNIRYIVVAVPTASSHWPWRTVRLKIQKNTIPYIFKFVIDRLLQPGIGDMRAHDDSYSPIVCLHTVVITTVGVAAVVKYTKAVQWTEAGMIIHHKDTDN